MREMQRARSATAHALSWPLLLATDGSKLGKTTGARTWLDRLVAPGVVEGARGTGSAALLGAAAAPGADWIWQIYEDGGEATLHAHRLERDRVSAAVDTIAELHTVAATHPVVAECRRDGHDLGMHFFTNAVGDALTLLDALKAPAVTVSPEQATLRDLTAGTTRRVSLTWRGVQSEGEIDIYGLPAISSRGRFVAFHTRAGTLRLSARQSRRRSPARAAQGYFAGTRVQDSDQSDLRALRRRCPRIPAQRDSFAKWRMNPPALSPRGDPGNPTQNVAQRHHP